MKLFISTLIKTGIPFGLFMGLYFSFIYGWERGLIAGVFGGLMFGLILAGFVSYKSLKFTKNRPLSPDEELIKEGPANHFLNGEAVGGWIYLTDKRLFFKSHNTNIQNHELIIPLKDLGIGEKSNTYGLIPNQLRLTLLDDNKEKFVVNNAKEWVNVLKKLT